MTTDDQAAAVARARDSTRDYPRLGSVKVSDLRPEHVDALYLALRRHGSGRAGAALPE